MKPKAWVASVLVSLLVLLTPLAWASPVDPSWIKGIYDDGDHDDVVTYLTSDAFGIPVLPVYHAGRLLVFAPLDPAFDGGRIASPLLLSHPPRAPPLS
jgi:hypothetical protein